MEIAAPIAYEGDRGFPMKRVICLLALILAGCASGPPPTPEQRALAQQQFMQGLMLMQLSQPRPQPMPMPAAPITCNTWRYSGQGSTTTCH